MTMTEVNGKKNYTLKAVSPQPEPTLTSTRRSLRWEWMRRNLNIEIAAAQASRVVEDIEERKIQYYSLSSANRRHFLMHVVRAAIEDTKLLVSQLVFELGISRNSVETMIKETSENGWVAIEKDGKGHKHVWAEEVLVNCYYNYSKWLFRSVKNLNLRKLTEDIVRIEALYDQMEQGKFTDN